MNLRLHRPALALGLILGFFFFTYTHAETVSQIWQNVYDSVNTALRVNIVVS